MFRYNFCGLVHSEPKHSVFVKHRPNRANGMPEFYSDIPFMSLVANFSNTGKNITKHMVLGYITRN